MKKFFIDLNLKSLMDLRANGFSNGETVSNGDNCTPKNINIAQSVTKNEKYRNLSGNFYITIYLTLTEKNIGFFDSINDNAQTIESQKNQVKFNGSSRINELDAYGDISKNFNYSENGSYSGVLADTPLFTDYVINGISSSHGYVFGTGLQMRDYKTKKSIYYDTDLKDYVEVFLTEGKYFTEGNNGDLSHSNIFKDDLYVGVGEISEIKNDINIVRGNYSVFEKYYQLSQISTLSQIIDNNID